MTVTVTEHFLDFLELAPRAMHKPRARGLTIIRNPGYPSDWLRGMLEAYGQYVDVAKLPITFLPAPARFMEEQIRLFRDHQIDVAVDDPLFSVAYHQGKIEAYLRALASLGVTTIQVEIPRERPDRAEEEARCVALARECGLRVDGEVGQKYTAGDLMRGAEGLLNVEATIAEARRLIELGCQRVYLESAVIRSVLANPATLAAGTDQVRQVVEAIGLERVVIEINGMLMSFDDAQLTRYWAVRTFGPEVNMGGGEALTDILFIEAVRRGISFVHGVKHNPRLWVNSLARHGGRAAETWWLEAEPLADELTS